MPELVCSADDRAAWLAARSAGVTATDIVTILGLSSYDSVYSLFWRKMGQVPDQPDNDRFRLGRFLQGYVIERWSQANDWRAPYLDTGLYRSTARPWQMATLDAEVADHIPLEVKTWADAARDMWQDGPPPAVRAQVLWQMDVMDAGTGHVGVLFLPSGEFRSYVIGHDRRIFPRGEDCSELCEYCADQRLMREAGEKFMRCLRMELPPPDPDNSAATLAAARARFAKTKGKRGQVDATVWEDWQGACVQIANGEARKRGAEITIREQLGEADEIEVDGELVGRRVVSDQQVKAHDRHMDYIKRVGNGKAGSDE